MPEDQNRRRQTGHGHRFNVLRPGRVMSGNQRPPRLRAEIRRGPIRRFGLDMCRMTLESALEWMTDPDFTVRIETRQHASNQGPKSENVFIFLVQTSRANAESDREGREAWQRRALEYLCQIDAEFEQVALGGEWSALAGNESKANIPLKTSRFPFWSHLRREVPQGGLFYPCCGGDMGEALAAFEHHCQEFHFVDCQKPHALPFGDPILEGFRPDLRAERECTLLQGIRKEHTREMSRTRCIAKPLSRENGSQRIWTHEWDALHVLEHLSEMAVFWYRGDSNEGGSGLAWFGREIFSNILDKLADGGLVVTDGQFNLEWESYWHDLPWLPLKKDVQSRDFAAQGRRFIYLGQLGGKRAETVVWQVVRETNAPCVNK